MILRIIITSCLLFKFVIFSSFCSICQSDYSCNSVRKGNYKVESEKIGVTKIKRRKKIQVEKNKSLKYKCRMTVIWLDNCTYQLINPVMIKGPKELEPNSKDVQTVVIIEIKKEGILVSSTSNYSSVEKVVFLEKI